MEWFNQVDATYRDDLVEVHREIGAAKTDLIRWSFAFWVPVALAVLGLYFKQ